MSVVFGGGEGGEERGGLRGEETGNYCARHHLVGIVVNVFPSTVEDRDLNHS